MSIVELFTDGKALRVSPEGGHLIPDKFQPVVEFGVLASEEHPFDPMERAFQELFGQCPLGGTRPYEDWTLVHEYALTEQLLAVTHIWRAPQQDRHVVAAKGAPETIVRLCRLAGDESKDLFLSVDEMAARGLRVLGVAKAFSPGPPWPASPSAFHFEFLGLVGLADPLRPGVAEAVSECHAAGIRVAMVTGDYPATAKAIARNAGLDLNGGVVTGAELAQMNDRELRERVKTVRVFARTLPEQKLRLVNAFKANGDIVAMTGDGVNDAPSLKAAHIGIAMGGRGTDVAREASAIVLLDDDFGSIVSAVRLGRRIYDNLRKAMGFLLAVHVPIAGLSLFPIIFGWPLILTPVHIAFLELVIDPVASIVFEAETEESDIMRKPPRNSQAPLFSPMTIGWSIVQGVWVFLLAGAVLVEALSRGIPESEVRAVTFASLVTGNLLLIFINRSFSSSIVAALRRPNAALWLVIAAAGALLAITLTVSSVRALFLFGPLTTIDITRVLAVAIAVIGFLEALKAILGAQRLAPR